MGAARFLSNALMVLLGSALFAFAIHYFVISNEFMEGGLTGIVLLLHYAFDVAPSLTTLLLNIPIFLVGWKVLGTARIGYSALGAGGLTFFLWVMELLLDRGWLIPFRSEDHLLAALYAGLASGLGLGIILRYGGSTGGSTLIARLTLHRFGWRQSQVILLFDVVVIAVGLFYLPMEKVLYTLVMVYIAARVIQLVNNEQHAAKELIVYSPNSAQLASRLFGRAAHGYAVFEVRRGPAGQLVQAARCIVARGDVYRIKREIRAVDPQAFIVVHDVQDVEGERY